MASYNYLVKNTLDLLKSLISNKLEIENKNKICKDNKMEPLFKNKYQVSLYKKWQWDEKA